MKRLISFLCFCFRQNPVEANTNTTKSHDCVNVPQPKEIKEKTSTSTSYENENFTIHGKKGLRGNQSAAALETFHFENLLPCYDTIEWDTLSSVTLETAPKLHSMKGQTRLCKVIDVYDGDTVDIIFLNHDEIQHHKLRLFGIDCPEMKPLKALENRNEIIQSAIKARDFLRELMLDKIVCVFFFNEEKFGRLMGNIYLIESDDRELNGQKYVTYHQKSVNQLMIEHGHAKEYFGGKKC